MAKQEGVVAWVSEQWTRELVRMSGGMKWDEVGGGERKWEWEMFQEAMTLSLSDSTRDFDPSMSPMALRRLFSGLIEMQDDPAGDPDNPLCRLCHSTLREFLEENAAILYLDSPNRTHSLTYTISRSAIGDLCLRYMSLDRYRELLNVTQTNLVEASFLQPGDSFDHALLPYCAKFWVRHLNELAMTRSLQIWLMTFLTSSNFQTLLQARSFC